MRCGASAALILTLRCILAALLTAFLAVFFFVAREAALSVYEPRGFTSEYDRDVSYIFSACKEEDGLAEFSRRTLEAAGSLDEVRGFCGAELHFDSGSLRSWSLFFRLRDVRPFRGILEVTSAGLAAETYIHRHFARAPRTTSAESALRQLCDAQNQAGIIGTELSRAVILAGKSRFYGPNGEILCEREYK